jgi:iduronate 2-sulfatase
MIKRTLINIQLTHSFFILYFCMTMFITAANTFAQNLKKSPNILFIAVDDMKPILGCYGDTLIKSPNMDRLAKNGTIFLANYCQQAVCGPTRASLLTGKRPDFTKVWDLQTKMRDMNPDILTIPQYFISQGYTTAGVGKIYHPSCVDKNVDGLSWSIPFVKKVNDDYYAPGFGLPSAGHYQLPETKAKILNNQKDDGEESTQGKMKPGPSTESANVPDDAYVDGADVNKALEMMKDLSGKNKPFFLAVGIHKPHLPFVAPKKYWNLYNRNDMPLAKFQKHSLNSPEIAYTRSTELRNYTDIPELCSFSDKTNNIGLDTNKQKELIHGYYACVSYTDALVGKLLDELDSLGLKENTIIILWGDHGWHLGDHDLWCKHTDFEQATHAPLIISAPGIKPSKTGSQSEFVDVFPTLCDLAGVNIPQNLDGVSLVPLMKNPESTVKEYSVSQYNRKLDKKQVEGYSVRTKRYRYTEWLADFKANHIYNDSKIVGLELYDYEKDPLETVSQINDPQYKDAQKEMKALLMDYFSKQKN